MALIGTGPWPLRVAIFAAAEPLIRAFESFEPKPYLCPAKRWTIGYGTTRYPNGVRVAPNDPECSIPQAIVFLEYAMGRVLDSLQAPGIVTRSPGINQAGALLSLGYNVGVGAHDGVTGDLADSTLLAQFNAGDLAGAADHFVDWDKAHAGPHGELIALPGLKTRRLWEKALFERADPPVIT